ncbi:MAG: hypothetical protein ACRDT9_00125 [Agromyces sp.]
MTFIAKYPGRCDDCREGIIPGQEVEFKGEADNRKLVHVVCDTPGELTDLDRDAELPVCPEHWLVQPCGDCEVT